MTQRVVLKLVFDEDVGKRTRKKVEQIVNIYVQWYNYLIGRYLREVNREKAYLFVDKNCNVYLCDDVKAILLFNAKDFATLLRAIEHGVVEIAPVDKPERYEPVKEGQEVGKIEAVSVDSNFRIVDKNGEVIEDEYVGEWRLVSELPWLYEEKYPELLEKMQKREEILQKISQRYPGIFQLYKDDIHALVNLGVLSGVPVSEEVLIDIVHEFRELKERYPNSWKKYLIGLRSKYKDFIEK